MGILGIADEISLCMLTSLPSEDGDSSASASPCSFPPSRQQYHMEAQPRREVYRDRDAMSWRHARQTTTMGIARLDCRLHDCLPSCRVEGSGRRRGCVRPGWRRRRKLSPSVYPWLGSGQRRLEGWHLMESSCVWARRGGV